MKQTRLITITDANVLAQIILAHRQFLAPWDPVRDDSCYTFDGQVTVIQDALLNYQQGVLLPHVILDEGVVLPTLAKTNLDYSAGELNT